MNFALNRRTLTSGAAAIVLLVIGAGAGAFVSLHGLEENDKESNDTPDIAYTSSVKVPAGKSLDGLAKITADQAATSAATSASGTAGAAVLENENGNLVYTVAVTQTSGAKVDVTVDAGNGSVLAQEAYDQAGQGDGDGEQDDDNGDGEGHGDPRD